MGHRMRISSWIPFRTTTERRRVRGMSWSSVIVLLGAAAEAASPVHDGPTEFNIIDYGATPDDALDDRAAIQAAIDAASGIGGGIVRVPEGQFEIGDTVQMKSNVALHGLGATQSRIVATGDFHSFVFEGTPEFPVVNTEVRQLELRGAGNPLVNSATLLAMRTFVVGSVIDGNRLIDANYDGIYILSDCHDITVTNNVVEGFGDDGINPGGNNFVIIEGTHDVLVEGNTVRNGGSDGIHVSAFSFDVTVRNNLVETCSIGISLAGTNDSVIHDNTLTGNGGGIVSVFGTQSGMRVYDNTISGTTTNSVSFNGTCSTFANNTGDGRFVDLIGYNRLYGNSMGGGITGDRPGDANCDQSVDFADILELIGAWGACAGPTIECYCDLDGSGDVGFADLLRVFEGWD